MIFNVETIAPALFSIRKDSCVELILIYMKYTNVLVKDKFSLIIPFFHDLHASFINPMSVRKNEAAFLVAGLPACPAGS